MTAAGEQVAMGLDAGAHVALGSVNEPDVIRVLLIKDDATGREFLANDLSSQGFAVQAVDLLAGTPDAVRNADVIVFHCDWTKVSSIDLLVILQREAAGIPIVVLTGEASPVGEGLAFDKGAADVIGQSRSSEALGRRLKDVVKAFARTGQPQGSGMTCGKLLLRSDISRAYWTDADLGLTLGEYNIVSLLASNAGRYVTYRAIYDRLHYEGFVAGQGADGYRANVRSAIKRIRSKFRHLDPAFDEIENYNSFGYCWKKPD
jgi:two-component system response regulator ChvI